MILIFKIQVNVDFAVDVIILYSILYDIKHYQRIQIPVTYDLNSFFFVDFTIVFKVNFKILVVDGGLERLHYLLKYYL